MMLNPVYKIETERLVIRCYQPGDGKYLKEAIDESMDHLRLWMDFIKTEPETAEKKEERIRERIAKYALWQEYTLGAFTHDWVLVWSTWYPRLGEWWLEIGYWVRASFLWQWYATELATAQTKAAFEHMWAERMEIHCDSENIASAKIPEKLWYTLEWIMRRNDTYESWQKQWQRRKTMYRVMYKEEYKQSTIKDMNITCYDMQWNVIDSTNENRNNDAE